MFIYLNVCVYIGKCDFDLHTHVYIFKSFQHFETSGPIPNGAEIFDEIFETRRQEALAVQRRLQSDESGGNRIRILHRSPGGASEIRRNG
jgi:hypothetical protein